jgi:hypothetical protein
VTEKNGGDDGARTRDLRRDRFAFRPRQIMELPVLSVDCERQGPTRNAIKCPRTIHLVHAYFTRHFATKMFSPTDLELISHRLRQASLIVADHGYFANRP